MLILLCKIENASLSMVARYGGNIPFPTGRKNCNSDVNTTEFACDPLKYRMERFRELGRKSGVGRNHRNGRGAHGQTMDLLWRIICRVDRLFAFLCGPPGMAPDHSPRIQGSQHHGGAGRRLYDRLLYRLRDDTAARRLSDRSIRLSTGAVDILSRDGNLHRRNGPGETLC